MKQVIEIETKKGIEAKELLGCLEDTISQKILSVKNAPKKSIEVPCSEEDIADLKRGHDFNWTFDGVDVHLFQGEEEDD